ncbi:nuclear transport factor 2 family protein [Novosphingobium sp. BL-8H]|uniref:nuclear transport factor 2 family protein n=1 Tax=Novosphingobium sp. BL-8H TaxID=3127640 RepID=UPI003757B8C4
MPDPKHMESAVHEYVAAFSAGSADRVAALFAENATVEDPVGSPIHEGLAAIHAFYSASMATGAKLTLEGPVRVVTDYAVFAFAVHLEWEGGAKRIDVIDSFRFDEAGKVAEMRAFWGPDNMHGFT